MADIKESPLPKDDPKSPSASENILRGFEEAYRGYLQALQEAWAPGDVERRLSEAFLNYVRALREVGPHDALKLYEAYLNYLRDWREAWAPESTQKLFEEAYLNYARALQRPWTQLDVSALDSNTLAAISRSMLAASCYANSTLRRS